MLVEKGYSSGVTAVKDLSGLNIMAGHDGEIACHMAMFRTVDIRPLVRRLQPPETCVPGTEMRALSAMR